MERQSSAPAMQELKPSKIGNGLTDFQISLTDTKISQCNEIELKGVLRAVMLKVGVRAANLPNDEEKAMIIAFVKQNYGNHTNSEIKLAFDMAIADKLDIDLNEVNCYENFTCLYFSKIMTAYRNWAKEQIKYISEEQPTALPMAKQTSAEFVEFWRNEWNESKTKNYFLFLQFTRVYDVLVSQNELVLFEDEKLNIKLKVKQDLINSCKTDREIAEMRAKINDVFLKPYCKKLAVAMHFNKLIEIDKF
jgi:hypothetical protein